MSMTTKQITEALEAARARLASNYRDILGERPDLTVEQALVDLLRSPADYAVALVKPLEWIETDDGLYCDSFTTLGRYSVRKHTRDNHWWWQREHCDVQSAETKDEAKAACREDYLQRVAGMLRREAR